MEECVTREEENRTGASYDIHLYDKCLIIDLGGREIHGEDAG